MREFSPRNRRFAQAAGLVFSALVAGCDEGQPPEAAFGAKLVPGAHDRERAILGFDRTRTKLYLGRHVEGSRGSSDIFSLDIATGEEALLMEGVAWFEEIGPNPADGVTLFARWESADAPMTLTLLYPDGSRADFDHVLSNSIGWSDEFLVFLRSEPPRRELWAGTFREPRLVSGDLLVHDWRSIGRDQLALAAGPMVVDGPFPENPGIFGLDLATAAISEQFPAAIGGAEWAGDGSAPELASDGLVTSIQGEGLALAQLAGGCWSATEPEPVGAADERCYLLYLRRMKDGTSRAFVGLPDEDREIALPGLVLSEFAGAGFGWRYGLFHGNAPSSVWELVDLGTGELTLAMWDARAERLSQCPLGARMQFLSWRGDGGALVYGDGQQLRFAEVATNSCFDVAATASEYVLFSPQGSRLVWFDESGLWTARGDGRGAEPRLAGAELTWMDPLDEDRLLALRKSVDGRGLLSLDLSGPATVEYPIVEQVFASGPRLGPHFLVVGSRYNAQDRTGTFGLLDVDSNALVDVADSVADYAVGFPAAPGADSFPFAYLRIGRFASARDGIWVGHIPSAFVE